MFRRMPEAEGHLGEAAEPDRRARQTRRKVAGLIVVLVFGIPVVYSLVMGVLTIVRYIHGRPEVTADGAFPPHRGTDGCR